MSKIPTFQGRQLAFRDVVRSKTGKPALSVIQPDGTGRMGMTWRGSQNMPVLPVTQHLPPSRLVMVRRVMASGGGGGYPFCETWNIRAVVSIEEEAY